MALGYNKIMDETPTANKFVERIRTDMRFAMKAGKSTETSTLKSLLARFSNAEAVSQTYGRTSQDDETAHISKGVGSTEVQRKLLGYGDLQAIIDDEINEVQKVIDQLEGSSDYKSELEQRISILMEYK